MKLRCIGLWSLWLVLVYSAAGAAAAGTAAGAAVGVAADTAASTAASTTADEATDRPLRRWLVGIRVVSSRLDDYHVFGREDAVSRSVADVDRGLALHLGHRFGRRFLLQLETSLVNQKPDDDTTAARVNLMLTGTVLFHVDHTGQPYLVGGLGSSGIHYQEFGRRYRAIGVAAEFGGGFFVFLSRLVALDFEVAGEFFNWKRVDLRSETIFGVTEEDWSVQTSSAALKTAIGLTLWF